MRTPGYKTPICNLLKKHHLLSAKEIHQEIPEVNFSTIFRTMEALVAEGVVRKVILDKDMVRYELCTDAHGHFVCTSCGDINTVNSISIPGSIVDQVTIHGTCKKCI